MRDVIKTLVRLIDRADQQMPESGWIGPAERKALDAARKIAEGGPAFYCRTCEAHRETARCVWCGDEMR